MVGRLVLGLVAATCVLLLMGCESNPADTDDGDGPPAIIGVWERDGGDLWEFTEDDSFFVLVDAARDYCVINWGTYEVDGSDLTIVVPDTFCTGIWAVTGEGDTLTLNMEPPCESHVVFFRVSGPDHTQVPQCD